MFPNLGIPQKLKRAYNIGFPLNPRNIRYYLAQDKTMEWKGFLLGFVGQVKIISVWNLITRNLSPRSPFIASIYLSKRSTSKIHINLGHPTFDNIISTAFARLCFSCFLVTKNVLKHKCITTKL